MLVPRVPALVAGFREVLWLSPEGEIEALSPDEARARLDPVHGETPIVCHARAVARRLDVAGFAAFDLLELFAFVRPAQFCVPTPRGLAEALGLVPPKDMAEACVALATAARALLQELANETGADARAIAEIAAKAGWPWGPAVLAALPDNAVEAFAGVGNPFSLATLKLGERVVDLGSGGGFDCFIAASQVGPEGRVVGVDMTDEMLGRSRAAATALGLRNVEFR